MADLFASGRLIDLILIVVALEAALLICYWRLTGRGIAAFDLLPNLCAGAFLLVAFRVTLGGGSWTVACGCLAAAGIAHLIDVDRRWRR